MLYDSIHGKLMSLPGGVRVFPAHGAGSSCGQNLATETQSTIGEQRRSNCACQPMSKEQFVALVTTDQPLMPEYFGYDAALNQQLHQTWHRAEPQGMTFSPVYRAMWDGAVVLDSRDATDYAAGHIRGSISVPLDGRFAETVGMLLAPDRDIVIVAPEDRAVETATRLARIGFDRVVGHLLAVERVLTEDADAYVGRASRLTPAAVDAVIADGTTPVLLVDVRNPGEVATGGIPGAQPTMSRSLSRGGDLPKYVGTARSCSTARAGGAPRRPRVTCAAKAIPTSPT
jgi:rhodanese-related sulfurtransferase